MNNNTSVLASICSYILHLKSSEPARRFAVTPCPPCEVLLPRRRRGGAAASGRCCGRRARQGSPPGGYIGGLQIITDVAVDPAGNLWVANNWDTPEQGLKRVPAPALSTRFGGNGTVVFYGLAKPVLTPLIGPPRLAQ
jgi:hypothetical protein